MDTYSDSFYNAAEDLLSRNLNNGRGEATAYVDDHGEYSFAALAERASRVGSALENLGVTREQRVVVCMHDSFELPGVFLGAIRAGIIPVLVNTLLTSDDYEWILRDSRAAIALVSKPLVEKFAPLLESIESFRQIVVSDPGGDQDPLGAAIDDANVHPGANTCRDEACFWLYSSGSTGRPKGTVHVHESLIATAEHYATPTLSLTPNDTVFSAAKLFFAYGLGNALTFPLYAGARTILMAERPTPAAVFDRLQRYQATVFYGVPTLYAALLASPELPGANQLNLRCCTSAGESLPADLGHRWRDHFNVDILDGIGSTEMLHIFVTNQPGDVRYGTTGKPVAGYRARIVDDEGQEVTAGEIGELQIAGPSAASMYWNNRERTRHTFVGEWTRTGDKYLTDKNGYFVYCGRSDDMLKVGGIYVSPTEVESALSSHPAVLEAAVVGRKDESGLVKPEAHVVLTAGSKPDDGMVQSLQAHVKSLLAPYKYPRWINFVQDLPKTATGKIQRFRLRSA